MNIRIGDVKEKKKQYERMYKEKYPWYSHFKSAKERCKSYGIYFKNGTKFSMTMDDFKFLWLRDKANEMTQASIDRINSDLHYTLDNCRFIEMTENRLRIKKSTAFIIENWDENKTLKELRVGFKKKYNTLYRFAQEHGLKYKKREFLNKQGLNGKDL